MCGVCGIFSFDSAAGAPEQEEALARMSSLMARRGPDDAGTWRDPEGHLRLAFRRLSILDLTPSGHQPMMTQDGAGVLVCNGEIYNFAEMRRELAQQGVAFRSTGDAEVALQALTYWGVEALPRFNGMFALAFYDLRRRTLLLARDHAGIKPLYYADCPGGILFASQYDQILDHPWMSGRPFSAEGQALFFRLGYIPPPFGLHDGTHLLEPGAWLQIAADGTRREGRHFEFPASRVPDLRGEEAFQAVDEAVGRAVKRQMVSDVRLGTFLSGGIDSPLVAAKAGRAASAPLLAFTIGLPGDPADESEDARCFARDMGLEHRVRMIRESHVPQMLEAAVAACGEPFGNYGIFPTMVMCEVARQDVKVMLSGDGGDELFWGYPSRMAAGIRRGSTPAPRRRRTAARIRVRRLLRLDHPFDRRAVPETPGQEYLQRHAVLPASALERILPRLPPWPEGFDLFSFAGGTPDEAARWLRGNEFAGHLGMVLLKVDRASMHHSLEVRVPLLDKEVIAVASRVDWRDCIDPGGAIGKIPLRRSLARHTTHASPKKRGFGVPIDAWFRGPLREWFQSTVLTRDTLLGTPIDRRQLARMLTRHVEGRGDHGKGLYLLLSARLWEERQARGGAS